MKCTWTVEVAGREKQWRNPYPITIEMAWALCRLRFKNATNVW